jgi:hypothetical protein
MVIQCGKSERLYPPGSLVLVLSPASIDTAVAAEGMFGGVRFHRSVGMAEAATARETSRRASFMFAQLFLFGSTKKVEKGPMALYMSPFLPPSSSGDSELSTAEYDIISYLESLLVYHSYIPWPKQKNHSLPDPLTNRSTCMINFDWCSDQTFTDTGEYPQTRHIRVQYCTR